VPSPVLGDGFRDIKKLIAPINGSPAEIDIFEPERVKTLIEAA